MAPNLRNYIAGFSQNMREVLERFDFDNTISRLDESGLLFQVLERFGGVDLHPDQVDNAAMGTIFEELIRRFNEALNENPGEHFTPRDVVHLMVDLMLAGDEASIGGKGVVRTVYDPCCGSGGMLMIAKEHVNLGRRENGNLLRGPVNPGRRDSPLRPGGQPGDVGGLEVGFVHQGPNGPGRRQHRLWHHTVQRCARLRGASTTSLPIRRTERTGSGTSARFALNTIVARWAGLDRACPASVTANSSSCFTCSPTSRILEEGGSRIAIIMNGSPLFTGDAGSGESEIRRYIFENDLLEALIALPEQLFYNTGIATYVWLLANRKTPERQGKVQLIDASSFWKPMRKSLGDKRRQITPEKAEDILKLLVDYHDGDTRLVTKDGSQEEAVVSRVFPTSHFGYRKITVERPLRLNFLASPDRIVRLEEERGFQSLAKSKKRGYVADREEAQGLRLQKGAPRLAKRYAGDDRA